MCTVHMYDKNHSCYILYIKGYFLGFDNKEKEMKL